PRRRSTRLRSGRGGIDRPRTAALAGESEALRLLVAAAKKLAARHRPLLALLFGKPLRALRGSGGRVGSAVGLLHCRLLRRSDLARDVAQLVEDDLQLVGVQLLERADLLFQPPDRKSVVEGWSVEHR